MAEEQNQVERAEAATESINSSIPPSASKDRHARSLAALITAGAALIASFGAFFKPEDQSVTKKSYETLSTSIEKLNDQAQRNHDDIVALRSYLDGYFHAPVPTPSSAASASKMPIDAGAPAPPLPSIQPLNPTLKPPPAFSSVQQQANERSKLQEPR